MNRADAIRCAVAVVADLEKPPTKQNGYPADGWRPVTFTDRIDAVLRIADFLGDQPTASLAGLAAGIADGAVTP